jgi:hypothetical protein
MKFNQITLLALFLTFSLNAFCQTILINGKESNGKLTWSDFTGKVDKSSFFHAFTVYKFNTKFESVKFVGDSAKIIGFQVILELDQINSWAKIDKETDNLLVHEQGHFNLGILCIREIMTEEKAEFYANDLLWRYEKNGIKLENKTVQRVKINNNTAFVLESKVKLNDESGILYQAVLVFENTTLVL